MSSLAKGPSSLHDWTWDKDRDQHVCTRCDLRSKYGSQPDDGSFAGAITPPCRGSEAVGCCSLCKGTGRTYDESTGGRCWDCRGTGCAHPDPCGKGST